MELIKVNPSFKEIDQSYFSNYGGEDYSNSYIKYTYHPINVINSLVDKGILFETILDAGCASGELVKDFRSLGLKAYGIDNNREILKKSIAPKHTEYGDIRDLSNFKDNSFEVVYLNSLMYLMPQEILPTLKGIRRVCSKAVFLCNPFLGETDMTTDPYRTFLAKPSWWAKQFQEAGFTKLNKNIYLKSV